MKPYKTNPSFSSSLKNKFNKTSTANVKATQN